MSSLWDLRQQIESAIPVWVYFGVIVLVLAYVLYEVKR